MLFGLRLSIDQAAVGMLECSGGVSKVRCVAVWLRVAIACIASSISEETRKTNLAKPAAGN